jgi:uncharacterized protein (DUF1697 family)
VSERQVALLRGVNVGKAKRISMAELAKLVEKLGFRDEKTLLNSGNVVYTSVIGAEAAAAKIEQALVKEIGVAANVTVLTAAELDAIVKKNPLLDVAEDPSRLMVSVLRDANDLAKLKPIAAKPWGSDRVALGPRVAYVWCANSILDCPAYGEVNRALKDGVTARNWATTLKLQALAKSIG